MRPRVFASDNYAGICPEAWRMLAQANCDHAPAYGNDRWTEEAAGLIRSVFETDCEVFFTFNGTSANSLALAAMCRSYHAVICHELAHVEADECGAPEFYSGGSKLLLLKGSHGKVTPASVEAMAHRRSDLHFPKVRVLTVTQATEVGTVYQPDELRALGAIVHGLGMKLHMDGARFANAVAHLGCAPKEIAWQAGVDVLSFGGTKNGLPFGEAVVFFDREAAREFEYRCKQAGQLASKMRFMAAPWVGVLQDGAWLRHAAWANARAAQLYAGLRELEAEFPLLEVLYPCQANSVFVRLPPSLIAGLRQRGWRFYDFIAAGGSRLMCSWDTTEQDVIDLLMDIRELVPRCRPGEKPEDFLIDRH